MKILSISIVSPYPPKDGGSVGYYQILDYLKENHELTVVCPYIIEENQAALKKLWPNVSLNYFKIGEEHQAEPILKKLVKALKPVKKATKADILRSETQLERSDFMRYYYNELIPTVKTLLAKGSFDVICVDFADILGIINFLPENTPKVFIHHEIKHRRIAAEYDTLGVNNEADVWYIKNIKRLEMSFLSDYDQVLVLTDLDKSRLIEDGLPAEKIKVSPLAVNYKAKAINAPFVFKNKIVYLGPDGHYPNVDGIYWFLSEIWPEVHKANPSLTFEIIGNWSEKHTQWFKKTDNVIFHGYVPNLESEFEGAIMVVPLRIGGGMRMKILEAAAYKVPIISTYTGAEGLPVRNGENCILADFKADIVNAITELIKNKELQNKLSENAYQLFDSAYNTVECGKMRERILENLIKTKE